jgi:hypothetical protein
VKTLTITDLNSPGAITTISHPDPPVRVNMIDGDGGGSAAGGFLLYPNKPNNNNAQVVYGK